MPRNDPAPEDSFPQVFDKDISKHQMQVLLDQGVYRHLRCKKPGSRDMQFDIVTYPGHLCYSGDMGSFVFSRHGQDDMLSFFRSKPGTKTNTNRSLNYSYTAEKAVAQSRPEALTEFDPAAFNRAITERRREMLVEYGREMTREERSEPWESLGYLKRSRPDEEYRALADVQDWSFSFVGTGSRRGSNDRSIHIDTADFPDCRRYTFHFLWCCHALAWAVAAYDAQDKTPLAA